MSFSGFSEDDIRKLTKSQDGSSRHQKALNKTTAKKVTFKPNAINVPRSKNLLNNITSATTVLSQELPENAKLSVFSKNMKSININHKVPPPADGEAENINEPEKNESEQSDEVVHHNKKFKDLDEFEARQKLIEEQNRKRKELLAKALADRTKQTQEEAQRLNEIQEEFKKLDAMLSGDVKILRKQIETASFEYMECQKRYQKIEKEFLDAKVLLHQKLEKKEMLTEHLCTIIEKNEERKAEKLTELLQKLEVKAPEDKEISGNDYKFSNNGTT